MTKYREIIRLAGLNLRQLLIVASIGPEPFQVHIRSGIQRCTKRNQRALFSFSIRFNSGRITQSMVMKQRLPPITFETGSARKTPSVPI